MSTVDAARTKTAADRKPPSAGQLLVQELFAQTRASAGAPRPAPGKPESAFVAQADLVAFVFRPYAAEWFKVSAPEGASPDLFAVACVCSTPDDIMGVTLRRFAFQTSRGIQHLRLGQCTYCGAIHWSD